VNYRVVWRTETLDRLAELYVAAAPADRDRMAAGVDALNRRLAEHPLGEGESRDGSIRITFTALLMVRFRVDAGAAVVQ
jgi:hypothetical protein